jgi:hypothetical protein
MFRLLPTAATYIPLLQDALRAGDCLKVERRPAPNQIERGLA